FHVTGVQTCALPIFNDRIQYFCAESVPGDQHQRQATLTAPILRSASASRCRSRNGNNLVSASCEGSTWAILRKMLSMRPGHCFRSEERRVGKEYNDR